MQRIRTIGRAWGFGIACTIRAMYQARGPRLFSFSFIIKEKGNPITCLGHDTEPRLGMHSMEVSGHTNGSDKLHEYMIPQTMTMVNFHAYIPVGGSTYTAREGFPPAPRLGNCPR
eukprot:scaffold2707_cov169-Amphora_coffeaeformis.AAC.10